MRWWILAGAIFSGLIAAWVVVGRLPPPQTEAGRHDDGPRSSAVGPVPRLAWRFAADRDWNLFGIGAAGRTVAVTLVAQSGGASKLVSLDYDTGRVRWETRIPGLAWLSAPVVCGAKTIAVMHAVENPDGWAASGFGSESGRLVWQTPLPGAPTYTVWPFADGGMVVAAFADDEVRALSMDDGELRWHHRLPGRAENGPAVAAGRALYGWLAVDDSSASSQGGVDCVDLASGKLLWRLPARNLRSWLRIAATEEFAFVGEAVTGTSPQSPLLKVRCLSAADGELVWEQSLPPADVLIAREGKLFGVLGRSDSGGTKHAVWVADIKAGQPEGSTEAPPAFRIIWRSLRNPAVIGGVSALTVTTEYAGEPSHSARRGDAVWLDLDSGKLLGPPIGFNNRSWFGNVGLQVGERQVYLAPSAGEVIAVRLEYGW